MQDKMALGEPNYFEPEQQSHGTLSNFLFGIFVFCLLLHLGIF